MRFFHGPNHRYYARMTSTPYVGPYNLTVNAIWNPIAPPTAMATQILGYNYLGWSGVRRFTTLPTSFGSVTRKVKTFYTTGPWTTGMVEVFNDYPTRSTYHTGYDNRTSQGLNGIISLVKPRLLNNYVVRPGGGISNFRKEAWVSIITIEFLPEPRAILSLTAGVVLLAGVMRFRRN
jgi:hypothetical protein